MLNKFSRANHIAQQCERLKIAVKNGNVERVQELCRTDPDSTCPNCGHEPLVFYIASWMDNPRSECENCGFEEIKQ